MGYQIKVVGLRELGSAFRAMGETDLPPRIRMAAFDAATVVLELARPNAPVTPARRHAAGLMAGSMKVRASQRKASVVIDGKRVPYAAAIHWGWRRHNIRRNPFVLKALEAGNTQIVEKFSAQVRELCASVRG